MEQNPKQELVSPPSSKTPHFDFEDLLPTWKEERQAKSFMRVLNRKHPSDKEKLHVLKALRDLIIADLPVTED